LHRTRRFEEYSKRFNLKYLMDSDG
jgi:hypothetical protein